MNHKKSSEELKKSPKASPSCEENNEEKPPKKPLGKKAVIAITCVSLVLAILASVAAVGLMWLKPWKNDIYSRTSYVTSDYWANAANDWVVATMGEYELTNGQLQVFYWMQVYDLLEYYSQQYGEYASYYLGIDLSKPLSEQTYIGDETKTWEQYFLEDAVYAWHHLQALADEAKENGYQIPPERQEELNGMYATLEESAKKQNLESVEAMLREEVGIGPTFEDYYHYWELYYIGNLYFSHVSNNLTFTEGELDAYFQENKEHFEINYGVTKESGYLVDFRNILLTPAKAKDEKGNMVYTEETWEECRQKAAAILETWEGSDKLEETFAGLAKIKSDDKNTASNGGLYRYIPKDYWATVDVRHILVMPKGGTKDDNGAVTYSEEEWEACRVAAQALLDQYLAGEKTETAFGELANKHSEDQNGKVTNGGLYANVYSGQMVKAFNDWIFDGSRQAGDTDLVKTEYGYHVMYFVQRKGPVDEWLFTEGRKAGDVTMVKTEEGYQILYYIGDELEWTAFTREELHSKTTEELRESYATERPIEVSYWKMMLGTYPATTRPAQTQQTQLPQ